MNLYTPHTSKYNACAIRDMEKMVRNFRVIYKNNKIDCFFLSFHLCSTQFMSLTLNDNIRFHQNVKIYCCDADGAIQ